MIRHLQLKNFKCFDDLSFTLGDLTLITGENGAGKSSIIQALLLLRQSNDDKVVDLHKQVRINGDLIDLGSADAMRYALSETGDIDIILSNEKQEKLAFSIKDAVTTDVVNRCESSDNLDDALRTWSLFDKDFVYLYADRTAPCSSYQKGIESNTDSRLGDKHGNRAAFRLYSSMSNNEKVAVREMCLRAEHDTVFVSTSDWIGHIMGYPVTVSAAPLPNDQVELKYAREMQGGDVQLSPMNVAFGNSYIFPIVLGVLTAPAGSLVIIENPEAHLHPAAQLRMGCFLARAALNGIQVIVETHSDHLLNGVRVMAKGEQLTEKCHVEIHYIFQEEENSNLHSDDRIVLESDGSLDHWPSGFFDEWELALRAINS